MKKIFTGLIETVGTIRRTKHREGGMLLGITPDLKSFEVALGGSVAIDGACLTLEYCESNVYYFTAVQETLNRTTLGAATIGRRVNMERAVKLGDRLDGHMVLGHIDAVAQITGDRKTGAELLRTFKVPPELSKFMAQKGSVSIDGISLTIAKSTSESVSVAIIPHTLSATTMDFKKNGDWVNIECDVLARYLERLMGENVNGSTNSSLLNRMERLGF